ncbi:hypothetical protein ColTof4_04016 [Colletotrichum tofieldiae]|nr:hypothetical protein ColTof3_13864 [Colletotrichum tofieldiae]GKT71593.1 hypothetical protein ColTof4_04016 [Colletotrichum tofieldiae]GKT95246.1 hypothetical protein Ct61P_13096 [Colletotrichum tofieldiae]
MTKSGVSLANLAQLDVESPSKSRTILEAVLLETIHVKPPTICPLECRLRLPQVTAKPTLGY